MAELSRQEFLNRWTERPVLRRSPRVRVRTEHTRVDSFFTEIVEGFVGAIRFSSDYSGDGIDDVVVCVGGDGRHGNGHWVTAFMGTSTTSLGLSKHIKVTVELIGESDDCVLDYGDGSGCPGCRDDRDGVIVEQRQHWRRES